MLRIDKIQTIEGITVYGDDATPNRFFLLADRPRFSINDGGLPAFAFYKYRNPIDRAGKKGGGFLVCDVEFVVPEAKRKVVVEALQAQLDQQFKALNLPPPQVEIGTITYTRGAARLNVENLSANFVEKVFNPGKPSLFGRNITPFTVELSDTGATFFEQALQNKGGFVQASYDLYCSVKLPPITATVWFNSNKFYSFVETYKETSSSEGIFHKIGRWLFGGGSSDERTITQTVSEVATNNEWAGVDLNFNFNLPDPKLDAELKNKIRDWAWDTLREAVKRMTTDPLKPATEAERKVPENVTEFRSEISKHEFSSFRQTYRESQVIEWNMAPQGTLEPIVNLKDKENKPLKWEDFAKVVDLDDPFFRSLDVSVRANADFKNLPIDSVEVHLDYKEGSVHTLADYSFTAADKIEHFRSYIENDKRTFTYYFEVNYKGESVAFKSKPFTTDEQFLTINVGDLGILAVDILPGDINWAQVDKAQVTIRYEPDSGEAIEQQFMLDKTTTSHAMRVVTHEQVANAYRYGVKYFMKDGKEYTVREEQSRSPNLYINDPFAGMKTVSFRALGDLDKDIQIMYLDAKYVDDRNGYTSTTTVALSKAQPFFDWSFPVIDARVGKVLYSGSIQYKNGSVDTVTEREAESATVLFGPTDMLEVKVLGNLVDFTSTQLVVVSLHYTDAANSIDERTDLIFEPTAKAPQTWSVHLRDRSAQSYEWKATYYMADGTSREMAPKLSTATSLVLPRSAV